MLTHMALHPNLIDTTREKFAELAPEELHSIAESAGDPNEALIAVSLLRNGLDDHEDTLVTKARIEGASWATIARCLGRTKQAVWMKHRDSDEPAPEDEDGRMVAQS
jgi:hypothetical protein